MNNRARARPTARGAPEERSGEGLAASTLEQRLAAIKHIHESEGHASPTTHPQVSQVMQGIRSNEERQEALPRVEAAPFVSSDLKQALEVLPGSGAAPFRSETAAYARWVRGLRDRALLLLGFATALRPRELISVEKQHVARGVNGKKEGLIVHIPRSKADQEATRQTVTALKNEASPTYCPVRALSRGAPDNVLMMQTRHADPKTLRKYDRPAQQLEESSSAFLGLYHEE